MHTKENPAQIRAGMLSVLVHGILLGLMFFSVNWQTVKPASVAEVQLWDAIPAPQTQQKKAPPKPKVKVPPKPEPKPEPKIEPKPEPKPEPKAEIEVKKEPVEPPKPKEKPKEKPKPKDKPKEKPKAVKKPKEKTAFEKLQESLLKEDLNAESEESKAAAAASAAEIDKYRSLIARKINQRVTKGPCGTDKVSLTYKISAIPSGDVTNVSLKKSSGITACDEAVERAILSASPLPLPEDKNLMNQFRSFNLIVRPNDD